MEKLLTQRDVAKMLGISAVRIRQYTKAGLIDYVTLPGNNKPRYTTDGVEHFIERRTHKCHEDQNSRQTFTESARGTISTSSSR